MRTQAKMAEWYIRFQLWHRSFDLLYIPFTFRFAAALLSIFRYLKPAGGCDWGLNVSIDCFSRRK